MHTQMRDYVSVSPDLSHLDPGLQQITELKREILSPFFCCRKNRLRISARYSDPFLSERKVILSLILSMSLAAFSILHVILQNVAQINHLQEAVLIADIHEYSLFFRVNLHVVVRMEQSFYLSQPLQRHFFFCVGTQLFIKQLIYLVPPSILIFLLI